MKMKLLYLTRSLEEIILPVSWILSIKIKDTFFCALPH